MGVPHVLVIRDHLIDNISEAIKKGNLYTVSVLSGNRNFEGRINPDVKGKLS